MIKGSMVAIVTPFDNGKVDDKALRDLIDCQIENGTDGNCSMRNYRRICYAIL